MMRNIAIAAILALTMVPAAAQQSKTQPEKSSSAKASGDQPSAAAQMKLRQSLEQVGFKDVNTVDAAYLIHARDNDGNMAVF